MSKFKNKTMIFYKEDQEKILFLYIGTEIYKIRYDDENATLLVNC